MKYLIVHAHHEPQSFNGAMTRRAVQVLSGAGHEVRVSDLYAMRFDPVSDRRNFTSVADANYLKQQTEEMHATRNDGFAPDVRAEIEKLEWCDVLVLQFPLWWFGMPAILKGWVDRVFAMGRVYGGGRWYDAGSCVRKKAMVAMTTGGPEVMYRDGGLNPPLTHILSPIQHGVFWFNGFRVLPAFVAWSIARADEGQRAAVLDRYGEHLVSTFAMEGIPPPRTEDFPPPSFQRKT